MKDEKKKELQYILINVIGDVLLGILNWRWISETQFKDSIYLDFSAVRILGVFIIIIMCHIFVHWCIGFYEKTVLSIFKCNVAEYILINIIFKMLMKIDEIHLFPRSLLFTYFASVTILEIFFSVFLKKRICH